MTAESVFSTSLRHCGTPCFWRKYARSNGGGDWCFAGVGVGGSDAGSGGDAAAGAFADAEQDAGGECASSGVSSAPRVTRSEEHTSELQSRRDLVCRILLV